MSTLLLADAKTYLNITTTTSDAELQSFIDAAEGALVKRCGPLSSVTITERVNGGGEVLLLSKFPAISLTSVTPVNGSAMDLTKLYLIADAAVVEYADGAGCFVSNRYDVTYQAGRTTVPPDLLQADKEIVRHLWDTQRGGSKRPGVGADDVEGAAYAFTYRVQELWEPYVLAGIA
jgi:hypothetical protein